jgi:hypothetical protein
MLCEKSTYAVYWCSHSQNGICAGQLSGNRCVLDRYWYGCSWWSSSTSRTLTWDNPSSCGSHSTAAVMASSLAGCQCSLGGDLHSRVLKVLHFLSCGDTASIVETHHLDDINQDNIARIPMQQYHLHCCMYRQLRAYHNVCPVCIPWFFDFSWPLLCI